MLLSTVSVLVAAQSSSQIPEGLMNNPVYMSYCTDNLHMLHFIYYSTNIRTENFKHAAHSPFFSLQNAVYFIMLPFGSCVIHILYIECAKIKKISGAKVLNIQNGPKVGAQYTVYSI